jgi:hypothetical protein
MATPRGFGESESSAASIMGPRNNGASPWRQEHGSLAMSRHGG